MRRAGAALALLAAAAVTLALQPTDEQPLAPAVDEEVRSMLEEWRSAFERRDPTAIRAILSERSDFVWLEDGEVRYPTRESVLSALGAFPDDLQFRYHLHDVEVLTLRSDAAWVRLSTRTEIVRDSETVSTFEGVVSMLTEKREGRWQIVAAHTSNRTRR
ncbi:MAG: nuclear transport factor 2 family protein [Acidobacteria bacterium]|nr:MAG: nuclear transport factor 2 family protein [Acidobacteriota bacterium]REK11117.1 MAG: nuclear transport factor 2 family protein [Acidobacteriota bacterium]